MRGVCKGSWAPMVLVVVSWLSAEHYITSRVSNYAVPWPTNPISPHSEHPRTRKQLIHRCSTPPTYATHTLSHRCVIRHNGILYYFITFYHTLYFNPLTPNDHYSGRTAPLTSKSCILYIYSTNTGTEYFKYGIYSPFFSFQNSVCFIILMYLVPVLFTFYIQGVLKFKKNNSGAKRLMYVYIATVNHGIP